MAENTREINTAFGKYQITTFGDTATLHESRDPEMFNRQMLTINGIQCRGTINLVYEIYRTWSVRGNGDGVEVKGWHMANTPLYMRRIDKNPFGSDITDGMREKIREVLVPGVAAYLESHPDLVHEGWLAYYKSKMDHHIALASAAYKQYESDQKEATKASQQFADFINGDFKTPEPDDACECEHIRQYHKDGYCNQWKPDNSRRCDCKEFKMKETVNA